MGARITISFVVPKGYADGDYAKLFGNGGSGDVDWNSPLSNEVFELFPNGMGIHGFGHAPFGHFRWGHGHSNGPLGFGHLPFGRFPWGYGTAMIEAEVEVDDCGEYKFGLACYDKLGNLHEGSPEEVTVHVHIAPDAPYGLSKYSYSKTTDVLILNAA